MRGLILLTVLASSSWFGYTAAATELPQYFFLVEDDSPQPYYSGTDNVHAVSFDVTSTIFHGRRDGCIPGLNCPFYVNHPSYYIPPGYFWSPVYGWVPRAFSFQQPWFTANANICRNNQNWCQLFTPLPPGVLCRCYTPWYWFDGIASYF